MSIYEHLTSLPHNKHYVTRYINFLSTRKTPTEYKEKHHILPRSLFPSFIDDPSNIILLTGREHYIAHLLLVKAFPDSKEMRYALWLFTNKCANNQQDRNYKITSKLYDILKKELSQLVSERSKHNNPYTSKHIKEKILQKYGGLGWASSEIYDKFVETMVDRYGVDNYFKSPEFIRENVERCVERWKDPEYKNKTRKAISEARKGQHVVRCSCILCGKVVQVNNLSNHLKTHEPKDPTFIHPHRGRIHNKCSCILCKEQIGVNNISKHKCKVKTNNIVTCPHCNFSGKQGSNMNRWHFDNCKFKQEQTL
jgi:hypothetical protein